MKMIITESKMNRIVTKWLNDDYGDLRKYSGYGSYMYTHYKDDDGLTIFTYNRSSDVITIINPDLENDLKTIFGLDGDKLNDIFIPWFKERYKIKPRLVKFQETTYHCNDCGRYHTTKYHIED
jgi:hypothetical protein